MYHPPDLGGVNGDQYEFVEIKNVGSSAVNLNGMHFSGGIDFTFPAGAKLAPGAFAVLVKNAAQFAIKYPGVSIAGEWGPSTNLSNSGETLTLVRSRGGANFFRQLRNRRTMAVHTGREGDVTGASPAGRESTANDAAELACEAQTPVVTWRERSLQWRADVRPMASASFQCGSNHRSECRQPATADPDFDGLPNMMEFITDSDPMSSDAGGVLQTSVENKRRRRSVLNIEIPACHRCAGCGDSRRHSRRARFLDAGWRCSCRVQPLIMATELRR
jgi:hypothetical protein